MASHITDKEIRKIKQQFLALDEDGCCDIPVSGLKSIMQDPKVNMSEEDINTLIKELDINGNGSIDSCEFLILLSNRRDKELKEVIHKALILRSPIRKEFHAFDANGDGHITSKEFRNVLKKHKGMINDTQLEVMVKDTKKKDGGKIDYDEFILVITNRLLMHNMYGVF